MADLQIPPSSKVISGSHQLPCISFPDATSESAFPANPRDTVDKWAASFTSLIRAGKTNVSEVFLGDSYWRDLLCLTWNFHTLHGPEEIEALVDGLSKGWRIKAVSVDASSDLRAPQIGPLDYKGTLKCINSFVTIETDVGKGRGLVRLVQDKDGKWKCYTLFTVLQELSGYEEMNYERRPQGTESDSRPGRSNWKDQRTREVNLEDGEPAVLIVGSGQGGLITAARLKQLGIKNLVIDRIARVGDNWRKRYHHLVLHDPVWFDHMPYMDFPPQWPVFAPKDKLADWFEAYAQILELNIWTSTAIQDSKWNDGAKSWTVNLEREVNGTKKKYTLRPRHIILATGASGKPSVPLIPGIASFRGSRIVHSSDYPGLPPELEESGKRAVVIGSSNSGHDIARDYYEHGYKVTMVQRGSTHVVRGQTLGDAVLGAVYCEGGPPLEDADILNHSFPWPVLKRFHMDATAECTARDHELLQGLRSAGFLLDSGPDAAGLWTKYLSLGGGYYIDTGCSELIASGAIGIKTSPITKIKANSIAFEDGTELEADEIVFATGYSNMQDTAAEIFGQEVADKAGPVWGFDEGGETRGVWRRSGKEGFWYMGGNLALCRFYSRCVALAVKGLEEGLFGWGDP